MIHLLGYLFEGGFRAWSFLRLFDYLSIRAIGAAMTAFLILLVVMPRFIWYLHRRGLVDQTRQTGVPSAHDKAGTPVMGGAVMVGAVLVSCLIWCDPANGYILLVLAGMLWFAAIGLADDLAKWRARSGNRGMSEGRKLVLQGAFAVLFVGLLASPWSPLPAREAFTLYVPFVKHAVADSMWLYVPSIFLFVMLVGNAVNITDGLDGLSGGTLVFAFIGFMAIAALNQPLVQSNLAILCAMIVGALLGFLWFNVHPAEVFIGDSGALGLGATLAVVALVTGQIMLLPVIGFVFVLETAQDIAQIMYFKWTGRRLFRMAPLHHHFELIGWPEEKITIRFWIVGGLSALVGVAFYLGTRGTLR